MEREQKRLEQFRRLRKEIRGSQDYLVVGIDISKDTHNALMRNTSGKILYRRLTFNKHGRRVRDPVVAGRSGAGRARS
jgi:hypothetical protein